MSAPLTLTAFYLAASLALLLILATFVIRQRLKNQVSLMDGGVKSLTRTIRAHGNFVENTPFVLIALAVCELNGSPDYLLHLIGGTLLIGRVAHAYAVIGGTFRFRQIGMVLTILSIIFAIISVLYSVR